MKAIQFKINENALNLNDNAMHSGSNEEEWGPEARYACIAATKMRKLSLKNSILVNISFRSKARLSKVSSFTKLIRMICVILSFQIASNFCGLTFTKSALRFLSASPQIGIILVKKSAFNNWSYNRFKLSLRIRL